MQANKMGSRGLIACYGEKIMYINILGQVMTAGKRKRMHGGSAKARLHSDCPVTDFLASNMDLIYAHLLFFTNKTNGGSHRRD